MATLSDVEAAALKALDRVARDGVTESELAKAKNQLRARLVFDDESVTHIAHQLGYFETISGFEACRTLLSRVMAVALDDVARVARRYLQASNRTVGWFDPVPVQPPSQGSGEPSRSSKSGGWGSPRSQLEA